MKKILQYFKYFKYLPKVIGFFWNYDRFYVCSLILEAVFIALQPFPGIYLTKYTVDLMSTDVDFTYYIGVVSLLLFTVLFIDEMKTLFNQKISRGRMFALSSRLDNDFYAKSMSCKYERLFEQEFLDRREEAKIFTSGGMSRLTHDVIQMISLFITVVLSVSILVSVDALTVVLIVIAAFIEGALTMKKVQFNWGISNEIQVARRKYNYYSDAACDQKYFKDIKMFGLHTLLGNAVGQSFSEIYGLTDKNGRYNDRYTARYNLVEVAMTFGVYALIAANILYLHKSIGYVVIALNAVSLLKNTLANMSTEFGSYVDNVMFMESYIDFMKIDEEEEGDSPARDLSHPHGDRDLGRIFEGNRSGQASTLQAEGIAVEKIEFRNVSFRYPGQTEYALKDVSVAIHANEGIAMIGLNGAGKTTFLKLLMRLYDVTSGEILVNGKNIMEYDLASYLGLFSAIFQDYEIFSFTIRENADALSTDTDEERVADSLRKAGLDGRVGELPKGIGTYIHKILDKDGVELSGGEQQKLAFARALYKQSAQVIVFDEPTASMDPISEHNIYKTYKEEISNRISFFVSHRLSCVNLCDKVMVFDKGKLAAFGSHGELYGNNREYTEMYDIQSKSYQ